MASLKKIGRYYYGRWRKTVEGERIDIKKSLGLRYKKKAEEAMEKLEELEEAGEINPYRSDFDPKSILEQQKAKGQGLNIKTVREAADYFYRKKAHLSNSTVHNAKNRTMNNSGAYERAIEFFITKNKAADLSPMLVKLQHFENVIFRDIKPATMHFYYRHLRVWWNKLLEWNVVETDYPAMIKADLPKQKSNVRQKMMTEDELLQLFNAFDKDYKRKSSKAKFNDSQTQHWFKPLISVYFYCGLRKHEAAYKSELPYSGLKYQHLFFENGVPVLIDLSATKGPQERSVPIPKPCQAYLQHYLDLRGDLSYGNYIFVYHGTRRKNFPVTGARAYREFKKYLKLAGLPNERTLHGMRHRRVTEWLESGYNTSEAQFMAGHSNVKTTENYTHLTGKNLLEKQRKIDKRNKEGGD